MSAPISWEELRALSDAASPGPWTACAHVAGMDPECPCDYRGDVWSKPNDKVLFQMSVGPDEHYSDSEDREQWKSIPRTDRQQGYADGRFIVAAVNAVRAALGETDDE